MIQNYFYLNRLVTEYNPILAVAKLKEIFSQDKNKLVLKIESNRKTYYLEFSVTPSDSYFNLSENFSKAKKNTISFFENLSDQKILDIKIAVDDRIIKIVLERDALFFAVRGKFTNVFIDNRLGLMQSFKSMEESVLAEIRTDLTSHQYISDFNLPEIPDIDKEKFAEKIRGVLPIIGKGIILELKSRNMQSPADELYNILSEIKSSRPAVFIDEKNFMVKPGFETFKSIQYDKVMLFDTLREAHSFLISKKHFLEAKEYRLKLIRKQIDRDSIKLSNKINNLRSLLEKGSKEVDYKNIANLLLVNLNSFHLGMTEVKLQDIISGTGEKVIRLDPKLSPQKNAERYFEKSRAERINFEKSKELLKITISKLGKLKNINQKIDGMNTIKELDSIMNELKIKTSKPGKNKNELSSKFKHYIIDSKYNVYVGKDSNNNDLLTTRFAKQNDYWFHARSVSGSHVVLRVESPKEGVPKNILKKTASLAAFHSKAKTSSVVPVSYTFKKYVVKKKGFPAGTVHLLREETFIVKPEVPVGCEYVEKD